VALGGWLLLGEYVNPLMWAGILVGSAGVVLFQLTGSKRVVAAASGSKA